MELKVQVNGNATLIGTKNLSDKQKEEVVQEKDGRVKAVQIKLIDADGKQVMLSGKLYVSSGGGLTARFAFQTSSVEIVEVDLEKATESKGQSLQKALGL